jgi:hypothetical protein
MPFGDLKGFPLRLIRAENILCWWKPLQTSQTPEGIAVREYIHTNQVKLQRQAPNYIWQ